MSGKRKRATRAPTGLVWRDGRAYFDRRHKRFSGGRLAISLRTSDANVAFQRHGAIVQLMDRGDWSVIEAIRSGEMHISDAQAALRDGDNKRLRRLGTGTPNTGITLQRIDDTDDNDKADWNASPGLAQSWGLLNAGQTVIP